MDKNIKIEDIYFKNMEEIKNYVFLKEEELKNTTEEEYKIKLKEEILLHKNNEINEIFDKKEQELDEKDRKNLIFLQINYMMKKIISKKNIYDQIPENLIDEFINECYIKNKVYIETIKKQQIINNYKNNWKEKNALWRFFNQKYSPKKINFDNMENKDISELSENIKKR